MSAALDERVRKLQGILGQATQATSTRSSYRRRKVTKRGQKIEALEFAAGASEAVAEEDVRPTKNRVADSKTGQLRLRVVEGDEA